MPGGTSPAPTRQTATQASPLQKSHHTSPRPLGAPGPDSAKGELARRGRGGHLLQLLRVERRAQGLKQRDEIVVAERQTLDRELVLVDVDDDRAAAGLDAHAVGGVEAF